MELKGFGFTDEGTAFVDALEKRQSTFGSLEIACHKASMPLSRSNMIRVLRLDNIIETLTVSSMDKDLLFLPFLAKVKALNYTMHARHMPHADIDSLDIVTSDLSLGIDFQDSDMNWHEHLISLFQRMQGLGHFERLSFSFQFPVPWFRQERIGPVVSALIDVFKGTANLKHLDLRRIQHNLNQDATHLEGIFRAPSAAYPAGCYADAGHDDYDWSPWDFSSLERLLDRNRNVTVCNYRGKNFTNKGSIDKLYALNRFHCGSTELMKEDTSLRPLLVVTALAESASENFQYTALLLSDHADMLCELIQVVNIDV